MALLTWGVIGLGDVTRSFAADAWRRSVAVVETARKGMRTWVDRHGAGCAVEVSASCTPWTRRPVMASMPYAGGRASSIGDIVRRCDYALVKAVRSVGLSAGHTWLLQKERGLSRGGTEATGDFFQRIVVYGVKDPDGFVESLEMLLDVCAKDVAARLVSRSGRKVVQLSCDYAAGARKRLVTHEVFLVRDAPRPMAGDGGPGPRLCVIVTELGSDARSVRRLARLGCPLTVAVVPHRKESVETVGSAARLGFDVLIQQPMEGTEAVGSIGMETGPDRSRDIISGNAARYPQACGLMNHDGDVITASRKACMPLVEEAARCGLFVVDAMNHPAGELAATARMIGLASWRRTLAADGPTVEACLARLLQAERHAKAHGTCIVTMRATDAALTALEQWLPKRDPSVTLAPVRRQGG